MVSPLQRLRRGTFPGVLVALCIAGQSAGAAHEIFTRHALCPEHGETVDVRTDTWVGRAGGPERSGLTGARGDGTLSPSRTGVAPSEHDHCVLAANREKKALALPPAGIDVGPGFAISPLSLGPASRRSSRMSILALAPKASPPV